MQTYLDMMEDSLDKKIEVMKKIEQINLRQKEILEANAENTGDLFDESVKEKGELVDELTKLNDGFANLFDKTKEEIEGRKDLYKNQIMRMQDKIRSITDLSATLEVQEKRNKNLADGYFSTVRKNMKLGKQSAAAALNYHFVMNKSSNVRPQFFDTNG